MNAKISEILNRFKEEGSLISLLQETQDNFGYIPYEAIKFFSEELNIPMSRFYGILTFYSQFHIHPLGRNIITACTGTACHIKGSEGLINCAKAELEILDEDTTPDKEFTIEKVNCLGVCSLAPVFVINKKVFGNITQERLIKELKEIKNKNE